MLLGAVVAAAAEPAPLRVGVSDTPPFAIKHPDGSWDGIAVDLWNDVASALGRTWTFDERPLTAQMTGIQDGSLDVVLGPMAISPEHHEVAGLSSPYLAAAIAVAVRPQPEGWGRVLGVLLAPRLVHALLAMGAVAVVLGGLVWLLERRRNSGHFETRAVRGLWSAIWWATTTITTVGYGDKTPRTVAGQVVAIVGMILGLLLVSVLTATFASEITLSHLDSNVRSVDDLRRVRVGTIRGSAGEDWLGEHRIGAHAYATVQEAFAALARDDIQALVYFDVVLRYWAATTPGRQPRVLPMSLHATFLGFGTPLDSPLLKPLDAALLRTTHGDAWKRVLTSYVGSP